MSLFGRGDKSQRRDTDARDARDAHHPHGDRTENDAGAARGNHPGGDGVQTRASAGAAPPRAAADPRTSDGGRTQRMATIGKSISFKGDLSGNEDLVIEGTVEGTVSLPSGQLTVGAEGKVRAEVKAKSVVVVGRVTGNLSATDRVEVQSTGIVDGDVRAPRLIVQEGAVINGSVEMSKEGAAAAQVAAKPPAQAEAPRRAAGQ